MKIAYLVVAHGNQRHLLKLIKTLKSPETSIFIHMDRKCNIRLQRYDRQVKVFSEKSIVWGSFAFIEAVILLLKEALKTQADYYILISGVDYPIKSRLYITKFLQSNFGSEFINMIQMPTKDKPLSRFTKYQIQCTNNNMIVSKVVEFINIFLKRLPYNRSLTRRYACINLFGGATWWALSKECIKYILAFVEVNPDFANFYKNTSHPDEMFFHTIVGNSKFMSNVTNTLTYTDWSMGGAHPMYIEDRHLPMIHEQNKLKHTEKKRRIYLFARKFNDQSGKIVKAIDKIIKSSSQ